MTWRGWPDHVIKTYPDYYRYFGEKEFLWNKIKQSNRNPLLTMSIGVDGLKTGNIDEKSGFGIVASAVEEGRRLILAAYGARTAKDRAEEARKLLQWGFRNFEEKDLVQGRRDNRVGAGVWRRQGKRVARGRADVKALLQRGRSEKLSGRIVYEGPVVAPIEAGANIGRVEIKRGGLVVLEQPLVAAESVERGLALPSRLDAAFEYVASAIHARLPKSMMNAARARRRAERPPHHFRGRRRRRQNDAAQAPRGEAAANRRRGRRDARDPAVRRPPRNCAKCCSPAASRRSALSRRRCCSPRRASITSTAGSSPRWRAAPSCCATASSISTRAYQGALGNVDARTIALSKKSRSAISSRSHHHPRPAGGDGLARAAHRRGTTTQPDRFEREEMSFHEGLRDAFLDIASSEADRCCVVDALAPKEEVSQAIWRLVEARFLAPALQAQ